MLDLGVCTGSLKCLLLTVESLLTHGGGVASIEAGRIAESIDRLWSR
jgi:hypothetical protein